MYKIKTALSEAYVDEDGILRITLIQEASITVKNIKKSYISYKMLLGERKTLFLIDNRVNYTFSKIARIYIANNSITLNRVATAFLIDSFINNFLAKIYLLFHKQHIPTRIFTSEEMALKWLKSFYVLPISHYKTQKE